MSNIKKKKKKNSLLFSYFVDNRLSTDAVFVNPLLLLLFERIAVTTTWFSFSMSPLARRDNVRWASVYSWKEEIYQI